MLFGKKNNKDAPKGKVPEEEKESTKKRETFNISLLDALALLDEYNQSHEKGDENVKSCIINLTKARRKKGEFVANPTIYSTEQLREEFIARALITTPESCAPSLEDETVPGHPTTFSLHLNGIPKEPFLEKPIQKSEQGLRQRKGETEEEKEGWTVVTEHIPEEGDTLRNMDPITLFDGMPPPALREAQKNARAALEKYIEAANIAALIIKATQAKI